MVKSRKSISLFLMLLIALAPMHHAFAQHAIPKVEASADTMAYASSSHSHATHLSQQTINAGQDVSLASDHCGTCVDCHHCTNAAFSRGLSAHPPITQTFQHFSESFASPILDLQLRPPRYA